MAIRAPDGANKLTYQTKLAKQNLQNQIYQTKAFQISPLNHTNLNIELWIELQSKITVPLAMFNQNENCLGVSFPKGTKLSHL